MGLVNASLGPGVPLTFGFLTNCTDEKAFIRSRDDARNKEREAAAYLEKLKTLTIVAEYQRLSFPTQALALQCWQRLSQSGAGLFCLIAGELNVISS